MVQRMRQLVLDSAAGLDPTEDRIIRSVGRIGGDQGKRALTIPAVAAHLRMPADQVRAVLDGALLKVRRALERDVWRHDPGLDRLAELRRR